MANENVNIVIKAVDKTKKSFRAVTIGLNAIKKAAFSMKTALIAVGIAGFGFLVKKAMNSIDALGKTASKIGITTEALGGLRYAAELTGVATNTLDMALQRMVRRVSEAALGTGEAVNALKELNIDAAKLAALSPDKQFQKIADAMEGVSNQSDKVRLAMKLFDSEGVALVNTLEGGSAALIKMNEEAERLGLRLSSGLVKGVEDANDAITTLSSYIGNVFNRVVGELSPTIEAVTIKIREWMEASIQAAGGPKEFAKSVGVAFLEAGKAVVTATASMLNSIIKVANMAGKAIQSLVSLLPSVLPDIVSLNENIALATKRVQELSAAEGKGAARKQKMNKASLADAIKELDILKEQVSLGEYASSFEPIELFKIQGTLDQINALKAGINSIPSDSSGDVTGTGTSKVDLTAMTNSQLIDLQNGYESMAEGKALEHQRRMIDLTHQYLAKQSGMQKAARANNIDSLQESGKKVVGALSSQYKWAFDMHKTFAIKDALIDTYKAVSTAMASAPPPLNFGLAAVALAQGIANVQMLRSTSFREKGGPITAGSPYIVGERGPELIVPNQAANVIPNDQLGGGNMTINVTTNDANGFDDLLTRSRGTLLGLMNQALNENGRPALV